MKDCKTFLKLQEAAVSKQAEAKRQGYEGNTNNAPTIAQHANNGASQGQNQPSQGHNNDGGYVPSKGHITAMIQPVPKSNKEEKSITRQVNLAVTSPPATTEYLHWSKQSIEFSRDDHPITVSLPGNAPLVLKAQIGTYDIDRVFMDAGSGINLIYTKTLRAMHISLARSCRRTTALRRCGSAYKEFISFDTLSKATIRLATQWSSSAGCKQEPGRRRFIKIEKKEKQQEIREGLQKTYTSAVHKLTR
jgi:hypothetical protein